MVNIDLHKTIFIKILREVYSDSILRSILGFKGGTAALLFYGLPRFSVDLDFDLLEPSKKEIVFSKLQNLLLRFGILHQVIEKYYTLFFLLNYQKGERNLKVEISKRPSNIQYIVKNYLGISMLVMSEADMLAGKLAALLTRKRFATRDMYDTWFFLKNNWPINEQFLQEKSGSSLQDALIKAQKKVSDVKKTELLAGLGELLDTKQKNWVREKLQSELLFLLKLYASTYENK